VDGTHIRRGIDSDSGSSYLEIIGVTLADQGSYICVIKTAAGTKESTSVLEVSEPGSFCLSSCVYVCACICVLQPLVTLIRYHTYSSWNIANY